jgi:MFS family permease
MQNSSSFQRYVYFYLISALCAAFFLSSHALQIFPDIARCWLQSSLSPRTPGDIHLEEMFYGFVIIQFLLAGILIDKWGIRLMLFLAIALCLLGCYFFSQTDNNSLFSINFSRVLLGMGIAFVTVSYSKVVANTMPVNQYALMSGLFTAAILLGSTFGDLPLISGWLHYTWQQLAIMTTAIASGLIILLSVVLQDHQRPLPKPQWKDFSQALSNPQNWLLAGYSGLSIAPLLVLGGIAGKPFFMEAYEYTHHQLVELGELMLAGLAVSAPIIGFIAGRIRRRLLLMKIGITVQQIIFIPLIYLNYIPFWLTACLVVLFGFASSAFILSFAIIKEINTQRISGAMAALINIGIVVAIAITDMLFTKLLFWQWDGQINQGLRYFSAFDYRTAFVIFPVYLLIGFMLLLFVDESSY